MHSTVCSKKPGQQSHAGATPAKFYALATASDSSTIYPHTTSSPKSTHHISHPHLLQLIEPSIATYQGAYPENTDIEARAFEEDLRHLNDWPPRSYRCSFCLRLFTSAQALGGHMNIHRRDRARNLLAASNNADGPSSMPAISGEDPSLDEAGASPGLKLHSMEGSPNYNEIGITSSNCTANVHTFSPTIAACNVHLAHDGNATSEEEAPPVTNAIPSATSSLCDRVSPLLKERYCTSRGLISTYKGRSKASKCMQVRQPLCLKIPSTISKSSVPINMSTTFMNCSSLLKDTLGSCNIIDLELRLGPKRA